MSWNTIANSEIDASSPLTETLITKLRDNDEAGGPPYTAGDFIVRANDYERNTVNASYVKLKEIKVDRDGAYRVLFDMKSGLASYGVNGRIYKNGSAVGTVRNTTLDTYTTYSEDISSIVKGDLIQIYGQAAANGVYIANFRLCCAEEGNLSGY